MRNSMSPVKEKVIELIKALPDDCTLDDIQYHIYVREKIERGLVDVEQGKVISQEKAEKRISSWLKSIGQKPH